MAQTGAAFLHGSPLLGSAFELASSAHRGQVEESDGHPYIEHPLEVARLLHDLGYDEEVVAAGLLHDTLERSRLTREELRARFGERVAGLVGAMTEPTDVEPFEARKEALRRQIAQAGPDAEALMAADKVSKSSSLRRALTQLGEPEVKRRVGTPLDAKLEHYQASLDQLERLAADLPLTARLQSELEAIDSQRAHDEELELARRAASAIADGDAEALIALCDAEIVWFPALTLGDDGGAYAGHDGVRRYVADLRRAWRGFEVELLDARPVSGRLLTACRISASARRGGPRREWQAAVIYQVRAGRIAAARTLLSSPASEGAGASAGLPDLDR